jgi:hypothetical protein
MISENLKKHQIIDLAKVIGGEATSNTSRLYPTPRTISVGVEVGF